MTDPRDDDRTAIREAFVQIAEAEHSAQVADEMIGVLDAAMGSTPYPRETTMQKPPPVSATELGRRLCNAYHPFIGTSGKVVPCGDHIMMARNLWFLTTEAGEKALKVLLGMITGWTAPDPASAEEAAAS